MSPALRALSPGTLAALVGLGGLKQLVAALGPAIAPLLGALLKASAGSLWARLGQPMGTTDGPRLVEVASELAAMYRLHPDPAGVVGAAAQVGAAAVSDVLASSPDKAGTEQAVNAARLFADAAASAPHRLGEAVARAFLVSNAPRQLLAVAFPRGGAHYSVTGNKSHFAREEAILTLCSIASLIPEQIGKAARLFQSKARSCMIIFVMTKSLPHHLSQSAQIAYLSWKIEIGRDWYRSQIGRRLWAKVKMCTPVHGLSVCLIAEKPESPCTEVHIFTFAHKSRPIWLLYQSRPISIFRFSSLNKLVERTVSDQH